MKKNFFTKPFQLKIEKPWGYEIILTPSEPSVTGKIEHVNAGCRCSLQYHDKKQETLILITGKAIIYLEDDGGNLREIEMEPRKGYFIKPFQKHRFKGITDSDIFEASTKEEGNTVRLEDDYSRPTETEEIRKLPNRGWTARGQKK